MSNYGLEVSKKGLQRHNITNFYSNDMRSNDSMEEIEFGTNNVHNIEDAYDQKKKLKEIINNNLK